MGKLVAGDSESYQYLAESIRMHPDQETLKAMMENAGLVRCKFHNMTGGIVAHSESNLSQLNRLLSPLETVVNRAPAKSPKRPH